ncbi:hypothetical protein ACFL6Y_08335 [Elusimicrobiota bacterium]
MRCLSGLFLAVGVLLSGPMLAFSEGVIAERINLSEQWGDRPPANQGKFGYCHAFAAVGLLEAAHYREYGKAIDFSEKWVLYNRYAELKNMKLYIMKEKLKGIGEKRIKIEDELQTWSLKPKPTTIEEVIHRDNEAEGKRAELRKLLDDANTAGDADPADYDLDKIEINGICLETTYPYWDFDDLKSKEEKLIAELFDAKLFFSKYMALPVRGEKRKQERSDLLRKCPFAFLPMKYCFYDEVTRRYDKLFKTWAQRQKCEKETEKFSDFMDGWMRSSKECGPDCRARIDFYLLKGIPVAATMKGYPDGEADGDHTVIISGFDPVSGYYLVRNSWGPEKNHPIPQAEIEHVITVDVVAKDGELMKD